MADGCIVWNVHNTVFVSKSKRPAICAIALTSCILCLVSRDPIVDGDCLHAFSPVFNVLSTRVGRRRKFGEVSSTECTNWGNDVELIPTAKWKLKCYFGQEFSAICNLC